MDAATAQVREGGIVLSPQTLLAVGEKQKVKGGSKGGYIIKRRSEGYYSCTCPAWVNLSVPEKERTCNHLKTLLGIEYERVRVRVAKLSTPSSLSGSLSRKRAGSSRHGNQAAGHASSSSPDDPDVFPYAEGAQDRESRTTKARTLDGGFNERNNRGPRHLNGSPGLLLAHKWPDNKDPTGYWLSEKLDGVRACWDGERMFARSGRAWNPPLWFRERIPEGLHLDGELWMKRDAFDTTSGICRRADSDGWRRINFMVFDAINLPLLYEERLKEIKRRLPDGEQTPDDIQSGRLGGKICVLPAVQCTGRVHLETLMDQVMDRGGEGLMLREPCSAYEVGRSRTLYKLKRWYDAEAVVVGYERGQGHHAGIMGGVHAKMECGQTIRIGSGFSLGQRQAWYPPVGKIVRYRFQELSHDGYPRFPIFEGVCEDKAGARDAIVRSTSLRADARADDLRRFFDDVDAGRMQTAEDGAGDPGWHREQQQRRPTTQQ